MAKLAIVGKANETFSLLTCAVFVYFVLLTSKSNEVEVCGVEVCGVVSVPVLVALLRNVSPSLSLLDTVVRPLERCVAGGGLYVLSLSDITRYSIYFLLKFTSCFLKINE